MPDAASKHTMLLLGGQNLMTTPEMLKTGVPYAWITPSEKHDKVAVHVISQA